MSNKQEIIYIDSTKAKLFADFMNENQIEYDYQSNFVFTDTRKIPKNEKNIMRTALLFALIAFFGTMIFQYWAGTIYYPLNIGNKQFFSVIMALPYAFEIAVLFAGISGFIVFMYHIVSDKSIDMNTDDNNVLFKISDNDIVTCIDFCEQMNIEYKKVE